MGSTGWGDDSPCTQCAGPGGPAEDSHSAPAPPPPSEAGHQSQWRALLCASGGAVGQERRGGRRRAHLHVEVDDALGVQVLHALHTFCHCSEDDDTCSTYMPCTPYIIAQEDDDISSSYLPCTHSATAQRTTTHLALTCPAHSRSRIRTKLRSGACWLRGELAADFPDALCSSNGRAPMQRKVSDTARQRRSTWVRVRHAGGGVRHSAGGRGRGAGPPWRRPGR